MAKDSFEGDKLLFEDGKSTESSTKASAKPKATRTKSSSDSLEKKQVASKEIDMDDVPMKKSNPRSRNRDEYKTISLKIPAHRFFYERIAYIAVIIILLFVIFSGFSMGGGSDTGEAGTNAEDLAPAAEGDEPADEAEPTEEPAEEAEPAEEEENPLEKKVWVESGGSCEEVSILDAEGKVYDSKSECEDETGSSGSSGSSSSTTKLDCDDDGVEISIEDAGRSSDDKKLEDLEVEIVNNMDEDLTDFTLQAFFYKSVGADTELKNLGRLGPGGYTPNLIIQKCGGKTTLDLSDQIQGSFFTDYESTQEIKVTIDDVEGDELDFAKENV